MLTTNSQENSMLDLQSRSSKKNCLPSFDNIDDTPYPPASVKGFIQINPNIASANQSRNAYVDPYFNT